LKNKPALWSLKGSNANGANVNMNKQKLNYRTFGLTSLVHRDSCFRIVDKIIRRGDIMTTAKNCKEFVEHVKGHDTNSVWFYYLMEKSGKQIANCKKCCKEIKCGGGSTSGLHTHLKTIF
jgi:hypothetical protein